MKKFTSLFALLSCLGVYNAQADVTVHILCTDPENQHLYWWDASNYSTPNPFTSSPLLSQLSTTTIDGITYYTRTFTPTNTANGVNIILFTGNGGDGSETQTIHLDDNKDYYLNYYGYYKYDRNEEPSFVELDFYISGNFNNWEKAQFTSVGGNKWVQQIWVPENEKNILFKIRSADDDWLGYDQYFTSSNPNPYSFVFRYEKGWEGDPSENNIIVNPISVISRFYVVFEFQGPTISITSGKLSISGIDLYLDYQNEQDEIVDEEFITPYDLTNFKVQSAGYYRPCANQWGTLCLPFEFIAEDQEATFYKFTSISGQALNLTPITGTIEAGTPIVFKVDPNLDEKYLSISAGGSSDGYEEPSVTICNTPKNGTQFGNSYTSRGTFKNESINSGLYFIKNDQFWYGSQGADFKPYRAWFEGPAPVQPAPLRINVDDTEDIQFVEQEDGTVKAYYDLQGRKLDGARKGLVIENGKIIMVK